MLIGWEIEADDAGPVYKTMVSPTDFATSRCFVVAKTSRLARMPGFEFLHMPFERFESRARALQYFRLHFELITADEVEPPEARAQDGAEVFFQILLHIARSLRYFRKQAPDDLIDTQLFHVASSPADPRCPELTHAFRLRL